MSKKGTEKVVHFYREDGLWVTSTPYDPKDLPRILDLVRKEGIATHYRLNLGERKDL